jgi:hypothetical protein
MILLNVIFMQKIFMFNLKEYKIPSIYVIKIRFLDY